MQHTYMPVKGRHVACGINQARILYAQSILPRTNLYISIITLALFSFSLFLYFIISMENHPSNKMHDTCVLNLFIFSHNFSLLLKFLILHLTIVFILHSKIKQNCKNLRYIYMDT